MSSNPKISVIVPVFNDAEHIERCAESILTQTFSDLDIIFVNDGSTDDSEVILRAAVKGDPRVRIFNHGENRGALQARKTAMLAATGNYVLFVDGDDALTPDACKISIGEAMAHDVDILHFSTRVIPEDEYSENFKKNLAPHVGLLRGEEILSACFIQHRYEHALWNKIYRIDAVRAAATAMENVYLNYADDYYMYFLIAANCQTYLGVITDELYIYNTSSGMTNFRQLDASGVELMITIETAHLLINRYLQARPDFAEREASFRALMAGMLQESLREIVSAWYYVGPDGSSALIDKITAAFDSFEVVATLARLYPDGAPEIAKRLRGSKLFAATPKQSRRVGVYYHRFRSGGAERIAALLARMWVDQGFEVTLFTDEIPNGDEYELPTGVQRVVLPPLLDATTNVEQRLRALTAAVADHSVDILVHHQTFAPRFLYDCLSLKAVGVPVVAIMHGVFSSSMSWLGDAILWQRDILASVDQLVVLSPSDLAYFRALGIPATFIPNQLPWELNSLKPAALETQNILWVGRITDSKRPIEAMEIFSKIARSNLGAVLVMVGEPESDEYFQRIEAKARELGIADRVVFPGYQQDVRPYYEAASVVLITSRLESFCMVLFEAKAHGLPVAMYEMPNLALRSEGDGVIDLRRGDYEASARKIDEVLKDQDLRRRLGEKSRASAEAFISETDIFQSWRALFESLGNSGAERDFSHTVDVGSFGTLLETVLFSYREGLESRYS